MVKSRRNEIFVAYALMGPFVIVYGLIFVYPSIKMFELSFTDAPLIGDGAWVGANAVVLADVPAGAVATGIWKG